MNGRFSISRRRFLSRACGAGAALAVAGVAGPLLADALAAPAAARTEQQSRLLMGTIVTLTESNGDSARAAAAFEAAFAEIERLIGIFDRHSSSSVLGLLNAQGSLGEAPEELRLVLARSKELGLASEHAFNPAIAPVVDLFEAGCKSGRTPSYANKDFAAALELAAPGNISLNGRTVRLERSGMAITLDGIAKGFIADQASAVLSAHGLRNHMVNAGGDIRCSGVSSSGRPWRVGVQHPANASSLLTTISVRNGSVATSGSYESWHDRARSRHHLISHLTGKSADIASVTVRAKNAMEADALATALAFMPPVQALRFAEQHGADCFLADSSGRICHSQGWASPA